MSIIMYAVLVVIGIKAIRHHFTYLVMESLFRSCDISVSVPCYSVFCIIREGTKDCLAICIIRDSYFVAYCSCRHRSIIHSLYFELEFTFCKLSCTSVCHESLECAKIN